MEQILAKIRPQLTERQFKILQQRLAGWTLQRIGQYFGVSRERIRQILQRIEEKLQDAISETDLFAIREQIEMIKTTHEGGLESVRGASESTN